MQKRSQETHNRIIEAALDLFAREGYDATGVAEICQAAGVSKGAFYHHFPTKHAVFMEILQSWLDLLGTQMLSTWRGSQNVPQALLEMAGIMQQIFEQASGQLPMFLEFWAHASRDPLVWQAVVSPYHRYQEFFQSMIEQGMVEGSLKPGDAGVAGRAVVALAVGLLLQGMLDPHETDWGKVAQQSMQALLDGLAKKKQDLQDKTEQQDIQD
jgi:AcrR family transcriptional regulator